jgi:hypothetical protein
MPFRPLRALEEQEALTPEQGYNVVGIDTFGRPDEQGAYFVGHYGTREEAEAVAKRCAAETGERHFVYGAGGS